MDGACYARVGEQVMDSAGKCREVFAYDDDGSLTESARQRFTDLP